MPRTKSMAPNGTTCEKSGPTSSMWLYKLIGILALQLSICTQLDAALPKIQREVLRYTSSIWDDLGDSYVMGDVKVFNGADTKNVINSTLTERSQETEQHVAAANIEQSKNRDRKKSLVEHLKNLTLTVVVEGVEYILELKINTYLFASNYTERIVNEDGEQIVDNDMHASHCYYVGIVRGSENSVAAVSTCNGIRGYFFVGDKMIYLEPDLERNKVCISCRHKVIKASSKDRTFSKLKCGVNENHETTHRRKRATILEWPQDLDGTTRIIEIYVVNDNYQFKTQNSDTAVVLQRMKDTINMASVIYHSQDLYMVLVGAEVWDTVQKITYNLSSSSETLDTFNTYRKQFITQHHDIAMLVTSEGPFEGADSVIGLAYVGGMCSFDGAFFICDLKPAVASAADTCAHECGHTLGLRHNTDSSGPCPCDDPSGACVMDATEAPFPATKWSSCSKNKLKSAQNYLLFPCLLDMPATLYEPSAAAICGNGLVETGEECDCGDSPLTECNRGCCSNTTCQLIGSAQCAHGRCCDVPSCTLKSKYSVCRAAIGECDLNEYCNGTDNLCPSNVYRADFSSCTAGGAASYCYQGKCGTRDSQCTKLWGPGITSGAQLCYDGNNPTGDAYGNCGFAAPGNYYEFVKCDPANVMCGLLLCKIGGSLQITGSIFGPDSSNYTDENFTVCMTANYPIDTQAGTNPAYVPNGAPCGTGMACVNQQCKTISSETSGRTCSTCAGNGVCNSLDQCHCNEGFAPPACTQAGEGGSLHSNAISPLSTTTSTTTATTTYTTETTTQTTTKTTTVITTTTAKTTSATQTTKASTTAASTASSTTKTVSSTIGNTDTSTAVSGITTTTTKTCTQKINCGFGGDLLVYLCIGIGGGVLLLFFGCLWYICFCRGRPRGMITPVVPIAEAPPVVTPVVVGREVEYVQPVYRLPPIVARPVPPSKAQFYRPAVRYAGGYNGF